MSFKVSRCSSIQRRISPTICAGGRVGRQSKSASGLARVGHVDPQVHVRRLGRGGDGDAASRLADAELGQLPQGDRHVIAAADVVDPAVPSLRGADLQEDQVEQVLDVQDVPDLLPEAAEADVAQGAPEDMAGDPEGHHALVHLPHLPGPGQHAAAVDHRPQAIAVDVLLDQLLAGELAGPVERAGAVEREPLGDPASGESRHPRLVSPAEPGLLLVVGERVQRGDRVDPAGAEEEERRPPGPRQLQAVDRAGQVRLEDIAGRAVEPRLHRRLGGTIDHQVEGGQAFQVLHAADVAVAEPDPRPPEPGEAQLAPPALEAVEGRHLHVRQRAAEEDRQIRADESGPARDQHALDVHGGSWRIRRIECGRLAGPGGAFRRARSSTRRSRRRSGAGHRSAPSRGSATGTCSCR